MTHIFREALSSDAPECVNIIWNYFNETSWLPDIAEDQSMEHDGDWWCDHFQNEKAWVAEKGDQIVGFCSRQIHNNNISALYAVPSARNSGVGKCLLDLAKDNCDQIIVWAFELNTEARRFYQREGLVEVGREMDDEFKIIDIEHHWTRQPQ